MLLVTNNALMNYGFYYFAPNPRFSVMCHECTLTLPSALLPSLFFISSDSFDDVKVQGLEAAAQAHGTADGYKTRLSQARRWRLAICTYIVGGTASKRYIETLYRIQIFSSIAFLFPMKLGSFSK